jgi:hypothetical protein
VGECAGDQAMAGVFSHAVTRRVELKRGETGGARPNRALGLPRGRGKLKPAARRGVIGGAGLRIAAVTAFSILPFTETAQLSGFFLKKKPPCTLP